MTRKLAMAAGALLVVGLTIVLLTDSGPKKPQVVLPDGSVLTVERVTSRVPHLYYFDNDSFWSRLSRNAPTPLRRFLPATGMTMASAPSNAVVLWLSQYQSASNRYVNPGERLAFEVVDEHGCVAGINGWGSHGEPPMLTLCTLTLERFPRRGSTFKLRVRKRATQESLSNDVLAELDIPNPTLGPFPEWRPEPLPIVRTNGDLTFVLRKIHHHGGVVLNVLRMGQPASDWSATVNRFSDATGNSGYIPLCTNEPAWKITASFYRNEKATFAPEEILTITNVTLPADGVSIRRGEFGSVQGVRIELAAIVGAGSYTFSNDTVIAASPRSPDFAAEENFSISSGTRNGVFVEELELTRKTPNLILRLGGLSADQQLLVRARDESGRIWTGTETGTGNSRTFVKLNLPRSNDVQRLDVEFIVHRIHIEDFFVAPPR